MPADPPIVLRPHQVEAMEALRAARRGGSSRWWVTMPPGAGKTVYAVAVARELLAEEPLTIVAFSPNTAIQGQWARTWDRCEPDDPAGTDRSLATTFTSLTYQSLAVFDPSAEEEDGEPGRSLDDLHEGGAALVQALRDAGRLLLVLDECHHLMEVWGRLISELLGELPEASVLALTATPPGGMTRAQQQLTDELFGPILYSCHTPRLVKSGHLAPYAELAWLVEPTAHESAWLDDHAGRWAQLRADVLDPTFGHTPFLTWLDQRFVLPFADGDRRWGEFALEAPEVADAVLRFTRAGLLAEPRGAALHERHAAEPTPDDWAALLDDWLLRCVRPRAEAEPEGPDARAIAAVRRALPAVDLRWTRSGIRRGRGSVDRVLARSSAKQSAALEILRTDHLTQGERMRALLLCDFERARATTTARLTGAADPDPAGSAIGMLRALLDDPATAALDPLLVTGRTVAGSVATLEGLRAATGRDDLAVDEAGEVPRLTGPWRSAEWVQAVTAYFTAGSSRVLVGTRGLLGEGWDAPAITTLVDLTTVTTPTAVTQTRGRALRVDPRHEDKTALIWTPVCVSERHPSGGNDWARFERKHRGHFTLDQRGHVVDGVAGVDLTFSPHHPPSVTTFGPTNAAMLTRAEDRAGVREAWRIAEPYDDRVRPVVRVRPAPQRSTTAPAPAPRVVHTWAERSHHRSAALPWLLPLALVLLAAGAATASTGVAVLLAVGAALSVPVALLGTGRRRLSRLAAARPSLAAYAAAVADGLHGSGLAPVGSDSVREEVTPEGEAWFSLDTADEEAARTFADAVAEVLDRVGDQRYLIARWHASGAGGPRDWWHHAWRLRPTDRVWHQVPGCFRTRETVGPFEDAWQHHVGGPPATYTRSPEGAGVLAAVVHSDPLAVESVLRTEWT